MCSQENQILLISFTQLCNSYTYFLIVTGFHSCYCVPLYISGILYTGSGILYTSSGILYTGSGILYTGSSILYTSSGILYTGSGLLYTGSGILYTGSGILYTGSLLVSSEYPGFPVDSN